MVPALAALGHILGKQKMDAARSRRNKGLTANKTVAQKTASAHKIIAVLTGQVASFREVRVASWNRDCKVIEWGEGVNELQREMIFEAAVAGYRP